MTLISGKSAARKCNGGVVVGDAGPSKVGLIGLGEAGNLGDDLILVAMAQALGASDRVEWVKYLSHGSPLDWEKVAAFGKLPPLRSISWRYEYPFERWSRTAFKDCDVILFGGGGLIQDSHHPIRPYHWIRFLPDDVPANGLGLGLGPVSNMWKKYLGRGTFFERTFLRDSESIEFAGTVLGWSAEFAHDFVDSPFLASLGERPDKRDCVGVALRDWPGLDESDVVDVVHRAAAEANVRRVKFFVLESKRGSGPDVDLARRVSHQMGKLSSEIHVYDGGDPAAFITLMRECSVAVSMKLHSSAIWAELSIPMYPIIYAPKMASFFGRPWRGLEVVPDSTMAYFPPHPSPRSARIISDLIEVTGPVSARRLGAVSRTVFQILGFVIDVQRKFVATFLASGRRGRS